MPRQGSQPKARALGDFIDVSGQKQSKLGQWDLGKTSFLKKRSKKLLIPSAGSTIPAISRNLPRARDIKVFWFFS
jgi:hypothetical protein